METGDRIWGPVADKDSLLKAKNLFHWNVSWEPKKKSLSLNFMLRYTIIVKLVFHEKLWKKNFTVYPFLKSW